MKCQNCNQNEANAYIRKNINGEVTEMHLCSECAEKLGVMHEFSVENIFGDTFFGNLLSAGLDSMNILSSVDRCEYCGSTFNDIVKNGLVGCAHCYDKFSDKLEDSTSKIHGKTSHIGKTISYTEESDKGEESSQPNAKAELSKLKKELKSAVSEQRFEDAAVIRDKIKELSEKD
ncbi:MAG: UvrB/UvrC motif-containing protein [Clostridiales bacterium]|nr:UvrB/UvrC motif-containing protein [Clostridiales bacterium]